MKKKIFIISVASVVALTILLLAIQNVDYFSSATTSDEEVAEMSEPQVEYGIIVDSLYVKRSKVRRNESLSDILSSYGVDGTSIHNLAQLSRNVFDVRRIRAGNEYALILTRDTVPELRYFIYEESPSAYVVFSVGDTLEVKRGEKPIERTIREAGGSIETSLWNAMVDEGYDPSLAISLSEIYAWTIDFFGIQKGDSFQVFYEELRVEDKPVGIGRVKAAYFKHFGSDHYAFYFEQGDKGGYYDQDGENLQRTFLKAPLQFRRISSRFSHSRMHPVLKIRRPHMGVDYAADQGTPVYTVGDGTVIEKGWDNKGGGNYVKVKHNSTYTTVYMHLSGFARGLNRGDHVRQGELIGYVGSTGLATGPHLDFRFYRNGQPVDPLKVESPPADPVKKEYIDRFYTTRDEWMARFRDGTEILSDSL